MKKRFLLAAVGALALCACTHRDPQDKVQPLVAHLEPSYESTMPLADSLAVFPDSIVVFKDGTEHSYVVDKENSYEEINLDHYVWNYVVKAGSPDCPDIVKISIRKYLTEFYGPKDRWNQDNVWFTGAQDPEKVNVFKITNEVSPSRMTFAKYPESQPYPEWIMENARFHFQYGIDSSSVPAVVRNATRVVIKDRSVFLSSDQGSVELKIVPLSDYETVYAEGYDWHFITEAAGELPSMKFDMNAGFDFVRLQIKPEERWICLYIDKMGNFNFDFRSWENLKRKVSVYYPSDEDFESTMEEGILPDCSDED